MLIVVADGDGREIQLSFLVYLHIYGFGILPESDDILYIDVDEDNESR